MNLTAVGMHDGVVTDPRPCLQCGYSLQGLRADGVCPECGAAVARSLQGNLLEYSSPAFVTRLSRGAMCVLVGLIMLAVWVVSHIIGVARMAGAEPLFGIVSLAGSALGLAGWWLLSTPDPALMGEDKTISARRILRIALVASFAMFVVGNAGQWYLDVRMRTAGGIPGDAMWHFARRIVVGTYIATILIWPFKTFASLSYTRALSLRIPSLILVRRVKFLMWLALVTVIVAALTAGIAGVLSGVGAFDAFSGFLMLFMCAGFVGVVIWCITYASLVGGLRNELVRISRRQRLAQNGPIIHPPLLG